MERRRILLGRWRRRSAVIHALRAILPALAAAMVVALLGWAAVNTVYRRLAADGRGGSLAIHMLGADFEGRNDAGKPFHIVAQSAERDDADPVFTLGAGALDLTQVHSRHGVYHDDTRLLDLSGAVHLDDAQGNHFLTEHALVDTHGGNVDGDKPVQGQGPLGAIAAASYRVRDNGAHVYFYGRVKGHIVGGGMRAGPALGATRASATERK
jgi:lipopolysaccharide export system protein LptC